MKNSWWLVGLLGGCSFEHGAVPFDSSTPLTVDAQVDGVVATTWSAPVDMGLSTGDGDDDPSLTDDMLEIYWGSKRSGGMGSEDIWFATRASLSSPWSEPRAVTALNTASSETTMKVTGDGLTMMFASNRFSSSDWDLFVSTRAGRDVNWGIPVLVAELSTTGGDYSAHARADLKHVVWCAGPQITDEALYVSERTIASSTWGNPKRVTELDEPGISECDPMEPNATAIYYSSARDGKYNVYRASRATATDAYGDRTPIAAANEDASNDRDPWVSPDERVLVFSSDRGDGKDRLYMSTR